MTWDPNPDLVERCERAPLPHALPRPGDIARTVLRAAVDSGELIPRERVEELVEALRLLVDPDLDDRTDCPYLRRWTGIAEPDEDTTCIYGCVDEPDCVTCVPEGGWPRERARSLLALYTQEPKG